MQQKGISCNLQHRHIEFFLKTINFHSINNRLVR